MRYLIILILSISFVAFKTIDKSLFYVPDKWPRQVYDFKNNPLTPEKVELGWALFYDPILSKNNTISCASCHSQYNAFTHADHALSHGINDRIGKRNSPALMNLAWQKSFMWDGAINHLDMQALGPISHPDEMGEEIGKVVKKLNNSKLYSKLFSNADGDTIATGEKTLKALSQFMLTLISANSKYDAVMNGKSKFTSQEKMGYKLFKQNCSSCHTEPLFTNGSFENNGLPIDPSLNDYGRCKISNQSIDSLKFKVPTLRNIEVTYPYMHDGRYKRLYDVLNHYTSENKNEQFFLTQLKQKIKLSDTDKVDIIAFLLTLTDKEFLFNQNYSYPKHIFFK